MKILPVPCSFDNYSYLIICEETGRAAAVDPTEAYPVLVECEKHGAVLDAVLCTHHHNDHIGEIPEILSEFKKLKVFCHASDASRIHVANRFVKHGDRVSVGNLRGRVLHTPGHTTGSICYTFERALLTGDTLFGAGCGRLFEGTAEQMLGSLTTLMQTCDNDTKVYFGHEYTRRNLEFALEVEKDNSDSRKRLDDLVRYGGITTPSTMGLEKKTNPFLRAALPEVRRGLEQRGLDDLDTPLAVFTQLRLLRNNF